LQGGDARVLFDWPGRNTTTVDNLVFVCDKSDFSPCDGGCIAENEVAIRKSLVISPFNLQDMLTCGWSC
jgi:hypothetical protein